MNIHGRAPGIVETRPRAEKPTPRRYTQKAPLSVYEAKHKWLIFNHAVYCIGDMYSSDYVKWLHSIPKNQYLHDILFTDIDTWDMDARFYTACELVKRDKIVLYDSRQEAERAMRRAG